METLDIINEDDEVIGNASYQEVHEKKLLHRIIHIMLFNEKGNVLLQLRSAQKDAYPLNWSFSAGGHVQADESYEDALVREIEEELGVILSPEEFQLIGEGEYESEDGHRSYYRSYKALYDKPILIKNSEVEMTKLVKMEELREMMDNREEKMHPEMVSVLKRYWEKYL